MTHDPEAAWPLTQPEPGYFPGSGPAPVPPQAMAAYTPAPVPMPVTRAPATPHGVRIAYLAIILGVSIPLTAIALSEAGLIGLIIVWAGIVLVAGLAFGTSARRS